MDKYLLEILKDVNTIIIPGLGALTITNTDTGEIMFMPFLKHDDGKLSSYIAEKESMDENDAKNLIAKYVREINTQIDQGESYDMFQFGSFSKNADGDVEFKNWDGSKTEATPEPEAPAPEPEKEEVKSEPKAEEKKEEKPKEEKKLVAEKPTKVDKQEVEKESEKKPEPTKAEKKKEESKKETKPAEKKTEPKKEAVSKPVVPVKAKSEMNVAEKEELFKNEQKLAQLKKDSEKEEKKKRSAGFYILITLVVLIVAGGTFVGLNYDSVKQHIPFLADNEETEADKTEMDKMKETLGLTDKDKEETDESEEHIAEEDQEEETVSDSEETVTEPEVEETTPEPEPEPEPKPAPEVSNSGKSYHIVAGAFSSPDNAERLAQSLRDQGYPSTTFVRGSMTIVSLSAHSSNSEAATALANARDVVPKGWILHWK